MRPRCRSVLPAALFLLLSALLLAGPTGAVRRERKPVRERQAQESPPAGKELEPSTAHEPAFAPPADAYRFLDAEKNLDSLRVSFADGRADEAEPLRHGPDGVWVSLGDLGRLTGSGVQWNPETWRGSIRVDSVSVSFVLDTSVFWVRGEAVQAPFPVRLAEGTLWIPLPVLDGIVAPLLGDRCRWDPATGRWEMGGPRPWIEDCDLASTPGSATLTVSPLEEAGLGLRWDPAGRLCLTLGGLSAPPGGVHVSGRAEAVTVEEARPSPRGIELVLRCDPQLVGYRVRGGRSPGSLVVEWTEHQAEVEKGRFQPLARYLAALPAPAPGGTASRRILLEVGPADGDQASAALQTLADRLRAVLEHDFGHQVIPVEDRSQPGRLRTAAGTPETPGVPPADCWVGLRIESWPGAQARQFLLIVPGPSPHEETIQTSFAQGTSGPALQTAGILAETGLRNSLPAPWGQVSRMSARGSRALARTMADHLNYSWEGRPVAVLSRPARIFRGLALPAVLISPALAGDEAALRILSDPEQAGKLAHDLAFALDEYLVGLGDE